MEYFYIGGILFFTLAAIVLTAYEVFQWFFGGGNGRPRL